jgi:hypothetical protein
VLIPEYELELVHRVSNLTYFKLTPSLEFEITVPEPLALNRIKMHHRRDEQDARGLKLSNQLV